MKQLLTIVFLHCFCPGFGQNFSYPIIASHGKNIADLIPKNWVLLDSAKGDLNNDHMNDLCLVIKYKDTITLVKQSENYSDTILSQPRILIISFYNASSKQYDFVAQSNTFILSHDDPYMEEPYQGISISHQVLKIDFQIFMNMGGWGASNNSYKFRYQGNQFILIGADCNAIQRNTGEMENRSYNFLTKKVKIEVGNVSSDKSKVKWRSFKITKLKKLTTFIEPFTWEVEKDYYL
ncbi:hypothetical protein LK994_06485 [Ferruginibacter lapsinanis]|uniref:hypothetical protein n=1 Tax=Ferruginibacter lapsinanis TaxID=563172 RepID=UPI001E4AA367|nr:hypothetical protein [Ferruginibacter lapsinanis]UEG51119.1 hypothetical protein LK994_06485 [Ferruginibacter lapsinanis]